MGIHGNGWDFVPWNLKNMAQRNAKYTAVAKKDGEENLEMGNTQKEKGLLWKWRRLTNYGINGTLRLTV